MRKKWLIALFGFLFIAIITVQDSFSFFDSFYKISSNVTIGEWPTGPATKEKIIDLINRSIISIPNPDPTKGDINLEDYVSSILFKDVVRDSEGNIVSGTVDPLYASYTMKDVAETIELIKEFTDSFLVFDDSGNPVFPASTTVQTINVDLNQELTPGTSIQLNKVLQTANFANNFQNAPILTQLTIESPVLDGNGRRANMSDYAVELLIDGLPFSDTNPFKYSYDFRDSSAKKDSIVSVKNIDFLKNPINNTTSFNTRVYRTDISSYANYLHTYTKPTFPGSWNRFNIGPNISIGPIADSKDSAKGIGPQQLFQIDSPNTRSGLILLGKPNGLKSEIVTDITFRNSDDGGSIPMVPLMFVVSRGLWVNSLNESMPNQSTITTQPDRKSVV